MAGKRQYTETKECPRCHVVKSVEDFGFRKSGKYTTVNHMCKCCSTEHSRERREANKDRWNESRRNRPAEVKLRQQDKRKARWYGITPEDVAELKTKPCEACGKPAHLNRCNVSYLDHNHTTGKLRGVLCHECNTALGLLGESVDRMNSLADYIRRKETE